MSRLGEDRVELSCSGPQRGRRAPGRCRTEFTEDSDARARLCAPLFSVASVRNRLCALRLLRERRCYISALEALMSRSSFGRAALVALFMLTAAAAFAQAPQGAGRGGRGG